MVLDQETGIEMKEIGRKKTTEFTPLSPTEDSLAIPNSSVEEQNFSETEETGIYNSLSLELEAQDDVPNFDSSRLVFKESSSEESVPLQRQNQILTVQSAFKRSLHRCNKKWMLTVLLVTVCVVVVPGVIAALIRSKFHPKHKSDIRVGPETPPVIKHYYNLISDEDDHPFPQDDSEEDEHHIKYAINTKNVGVRNTTTFKLQKFQELSGQNLFPIPDDESRENSEYKNQIFQNSEYFNTQGNHSYSNFLDEVKVTDNFDQIKGSDKVTIMEAMNVGHEELMKLLNLERENRRSDLTLPRRSPESLHQLFKTPSEESRQLGLTGYAMTATSAWIAKRLNLTAAEAREGIVAPDLFTVEPNEWCEERAAIKSSTCKNTNPYRKSDGTCNNLRHPTWGSAFQTYRRILVPDYADGISKPRISSTNTPLPNARLVSQTVILDKPYSERQISMMFPLWAQFIAYDMSNTVQSGGRNTSRISCCENGSLVKPEKMHPECFPIYGDLKKLDKNSRCTTFIRSAPAPICHFGPREQFNEYTSYLDGSNIYGSSTLKTKSLRTKLDGRLKVFSGDNGRILLPPDRNTKSECVDSSQIHKNHFCFQSGDERVNSNFGLTSMHTLWVRQHNYIASILQSLNLKTTNWRSDQIFEEARRIVIAQIQHITYNEFLPLLLGPDLMDAADLNLRKTGYYQGYDPRVDSTLSNVFATVANRFGHSMLQGLIQMISSGGKNIDYRQSFNFSYNPALMWQEGKLDEGLRGHFSGPAGKVDTYFTKQITEKMFKKDNYTYGLDIVAINIQRGRDHGIPGYTAWRNVCKLSSISSFHDLQNIWDPGSIRRVQLVYKSVEDIDLYVGGLAEYPVRGGLVGPTFGCLLADQFSRARKGDRFWYESDMQIHSFLPDQMNEIRKTTLAGILCQHGDDLEHVQPEVFKQPTAQNPITVCKGGLIPKIDYMPWKEKSPTDGEITPFRLNQSLDGEENAISDKHDEADPYVNILNSDYHSEEQ